MQVIPMLDISKIRRGLLYLPAPNLPVVVARTYAILHEGEVGERGPRFSAEARLLKTSAGDPKKMPRISTPTSSPSSTGFSTKLL